MRCSRRDRASHGSLAADLSVGRTNGGSVVTFPGRTRYKLAEARFFLTQVEEHYYDELRRGPNDPTCGFYLSAFVSAARAVAWIMRSEYGAVPGWEEWWQAQTPNEAEAQLMALFSGLRNRSQKFAPLLPSRHLRIDGDIGPPVERNPALPRVRVTFTPVGGGESFGGEVLDFTWSLPELEGTDLRQACRSYLDTLETLVKECEEKIGGRPTTG